MENFEKYLSQLQEECRSEKRQLALELTHLTNSPRPPTQDIIGRGEVEKLEEQDRLLNGMVNGISGISSEILVSIRLLKQKKQNINDLLNQLTSMVQAKSLITEVDKYSAETAIETLKKFVIELHYSLENVPKKYFQPEIQVYQAFKLKLEGILREKMDGCLLRKNMGELNSVTTLLNVLKIEYDVGMKYENVFKQTTDLKVEEVKKLLDKKISSFVSLKNCLNSNSYNLKDDIDSQSNYPFIFFEALVDALTIFYETMTGFKDSPFIIEDSKQLNRMLSLLFDELLSDLLKALRKKMDAFYAFDYSAFSSSKPEISIMIERESKGTAKFTKQIDEIVVLEYYLTEVMNISSQIRLFTQEATLEIKLLLESSAKQSSHDSQAPLPSDVKRIVQSFTFNEEVMGLMTVYNQIQERVLKMRLAIVMSTSNTLRALFYNDLAAIRGYKMRAGLDEKPGVGTKVKEIANPADFLDELYYCLKTASFRAIKSLDKITACSIMAFIFNVILESDLLKLNRQLHERLSQNGSHDCSQIYLTRGDNDYNEAVIMILNNTQKVLDYNSKLSAATTDFASSNFKQVEEVFEKSQVSETIANLSSQANQVFREQLDAGLSFLAEVLAENSYAKILQTYQAYDFNVTEQFLQEYELSVSKWSIAYKVMRCISGTTAQWRQALHPSNYASLVERLSLNISRTMFSLIIKKKFTQIGSILLSKEVQYFVESLNAEMDYSVGREFGKLHEVSDLLVCDSLSDASKVPLKFLSKDEKTLVLKLRSDL